MKTEFRRKAKQHFNKISNPNLVLESAKENLAYNLLRKCLPENYFPFTGSSLQFSSLVAVVNDIVINRRSSFIEFGSGISTIVVAKLAQMNNLNLNIVSIDHDEKWIEIVDNYLKDESIKNVEFIHAPLCESDLCIENNLWYNIEALDEVTKNKFFDIVLIDGPLAYRKEIQLARYPAIPYLQNKLSEKHNIFLDDIHRKGEKEIIKLWNTNFNTNFKIISNSFAYSIKGSGYNFI